MDWKEYERNVLETLKGTYGETQLSLDKKLPGRFSKKKRQIDILIEEKINGKIVKTVVDAKFYNKKINVKALDSFIGMLQDIGADRGIMISENGFTDGAAKRAYYDDTVDVEIDVFSFKELGFLQGFGALAYAGNNGVIIGPPLGWIIDAKCYEGPGVAYFYQRGLTLERAIDKSEFMYLAFWDKRLANENLNDLIYMQERDIKQYYGDIKCEYSNDKLRDDVVTIIRKIDIPNGKHTQYTGFVDFDDFIMFCSMVSPVELSKKNLKKLKSVMGMASPFSVRFEG